MAQRFLAFLLFGVLAMVAVDGFELRQTQRDGTALSAPSVGTPEVTVMDGTGLYPPVKKGF